MITIIKSLKIFLPLLTFVVIVTLSTSCTTRYVKKGEYAGIRHGGYDSVSTNSNTAVVSFKGSSSDSPAKIKRYLIYKCAQVASQNGYSFFVITSTSLSSKNINLNTKKVYRDIQPARSSYDYRYYKEEIKSYSYQPSAIKRNSCADSETSICKTRSAVAVIKMFNGKIPRGLARAYSTNDVLAQYGSSINR